jgi:hypothetical protein
MESTQNKMKVYMGEFEVVQISNLGGITINIGKNVHITIHLGDFPHQIKTGDRLPLFTEVPYANTRPPSVE